MKTEGRGKLLSICCSVEKGSKENFLHSRLWKSKYNSQRKMLLTVSGTEAKVKKKKKIQASAMQFMEVLYCCQWCGLCVFGERERKRRIHKAVVCALHGSGSYSMKFCHQYNAIFSSPLARKLGPIKEQQRLLSWTLSILQWLHRKKPKK